MCEQGSNTAESTYLKQNLAAAYTMCYVCFIGVSRLLNLYVFNQISDIFEVACNIPDFGFELLLEPLVYCWLTLYLVICNWFQSVPEESIHRVHPLEGYHHVLPALPLVLESHSADPSKTEQIVKKKIKKSQIKIRIETTCDSLHIYASSK